MAASRVNEIADELVGVLKGIAHNLDPNQWLTTPANVRRGSLVVGDLTAYERPRLAVQVLSWTSTPLSAGRHDCKLRVGVHVLVDGDEAAEVNLNECVSDVVKAVVENESLNGKVTDIQPTEYVPQSEAMERVGLGIATVVLDAMFVWEHTAP